ncbi:CMF_collapsed_G0013100.mRNA.1.CDS.1 [Saccharomyces cerevisiae]|nr:CMF_collapsed_G0013100.mRNA.1.CDS.1 [Saccharomyces cerevisiae]
MTCSALYHTARSTDGKIFERIVTACLLYLPLIDLLDETASFYGDSICGVDTSHFSVSVWLLLLVLYLSGLQEESADSSSSTEEPFPVLAVGKDGRGNYYVNSTFGTPGQRQRLLVDII